MRKRFEPQLQIGQTPIGDIKFPPYYYKSRDEQPAAMFALLHIFKTPALNEAVFSILEKKIIPGQKHLAKNGRPGMDLWQIFVLATLRHVLDCNWDRLMMVANADTTVRELLGIQHIIGYDVQQYEFKYQTLIDNVSLIDEQMLIEINEVLVEMGEKILKKKEDEKIQLKTDSYVLEKNIHFPTDLNLLWDSMRKCLDIIECWHEQATINGWRKVKNNTRTFKSQFRNTSFAVFRGRKEDTKKKQVKQYLQQARQLLQRFEIAKQEVTKISFTEKNQLLLLILERYENYAKKFIDQIERRLIHGEVIPASEKIYSIFEPETEWITKGKLNKPAELGHLALVTTNQYNLIIDFDIMEEEKDAAQVIPLTDRLCKRYPNQIESHSFDKGFYSKENFDYLINAGIQNVVMPKKGKKNEQEQERENTKTFKKIRNQHSAIESNINMLEQHGADRCPDKGHKNFRKYFAFCVIATNLHIIGNELLRLEKKQLEKAIKNAA